METNEAAAYLHALFPSLPEDLNTASLSETQTEQIAHTTDALLDLTAEAR